MIGLSLRFITLIALWALMLLPSISNTPKIIIPGPLIETDWLDKNLASITILDVRVELQTFTLPPRVVKDQLQGESYLESIGGHIPNSILVDFNKIRVERKADGLTLIGMVPEKADFEKLMRELGVKKDAMLVIVSPGLSSDEVAMATRLYWQLKYYGHTNMAILNGGLAKWILEGRKLDVLVSKKISGDWVAAEPNNALFATTKDVEDALTKKDMVLIDTRPLHQYLGLSKRPYVAALGHIPGAKYFSSELLSQADMPAKFLAHEQYQKLFQALKIDAQKPTITYCNSGHLASGSWFVLHELLGNKNVKLYDGSMHEWALRKKPVNTMQIE